MEQQQKSTAKKPKWLRILEKQSWQAELIISGIAIFGTLQLPSLFLDWNEYWYIHCSEQMILFVQYFFFYLVIGAHGLIYVFIGHFIIRALWIGFLGFNSVFPESIRVKKNGMYSESFMRLIKKEFPSLDHFNDRLDKFGSVLFSVAAFLAMIFLSIIIVMLVLMMIAKLFGLLLGLENYIGIIFLVLIGILFFPSMFVTLIPKLPLNMTEETQAKWQFRLYKWTNRPLLHIFYVPAGYITYTYISNIKSKYLLYIYTAIIGLE